MQDKQLYEYAVIRVVPRVEREEFLNVGVILYCSAQEFLHAAFELTTERLTGFCAVADINEITERLLAFQHICAGDAQGGPIGKLPVASRFRWLTAARSTIIQTSPVHPGLCLNAEKTLAALFDKLVR